MRDPRLTGWVCGLGVLAALSGCSNPREDVRVTLCRDLVRTQLAAPQSVVWTSGENAIQRGDHLAVKLSFEAQDGQGNRRPMRATCRYEHQAVDDTALTLSDPLSAYATSPSQVTLNGQALSRSLLAEAVKQAMVGQAKALLERAQQGIEAAAQQAQARLQEAASKP